MKDKRIMLVALLSVVAVQGMAQLDHAYVPIVREGVQWVYYDLLTYQTEPTGSYSSELFPVVYEFKGDTVIQGETYLQLWEDRAVPDKQTGEVSHQIGVVAYARSVWTSPGDVPQGEGLYARRAHSLRELAGLYQSEDEGGCIYKVYSIPFIPEHFSRIPLSKQMRELLNFEQTYLDNVEINGQQRMCWRKTGDPNVMIVEGIGLVVNDSEHYTPCNFLDFTEFITNRIFGHFVENGEIVFKNEDYDFILEHMHKVLDAAEGKVGVDDLTVPDAAGDGATYDMQGRRVTAPQSPGLYIRDGHKILVP